MNSIESFAGGVLALLDQAEENLKNQVKELRDALWAEADDRGVVLYRSFAVRETPFRFRVDWQVMKHHKSADGHKVFFKRITLNKSNSARPNYAQSATLFGRYTDRLHSDLLTRYDTKLQVIRKMADLIGDAREAQLKLETLAKVNGL